jgi:hypothetical protein
MLIQSRFWWLIKTIIRKQEKGKMSDTGKRKKNEKFKESEYKVQ